jgi:hypothetical protein
MVDVCVAHVVRFYSVGVTLVQLETFRAMEGGQHGAGTTA